MNVDAPQPGHDAADRVRDDGASATDGGCALRSLYAFIYPHKPRMSVMSAPQSESHTYDDRRLQMTRMFQSQCLCGR